MDKLIQADIQTTQNGSKEIFQTYIAKKPIRSYSNDNLQIFKHNEIKINRIFIKQSNHCQKRMFKDQGMQKGDHIRDKKYYFRSKSQDYKQKCQRPPTDKQYQKLQNDTVNQLSLKLNEFIEMFKGTKLSQQLNQINVIQQDLSSKSFEQIIQELQTRFISTIIKNNQQLKQEKQLIQLGFRFFGNLFTQMLAQHDVNKYHDDLFQTGFLFNTHINRQLIIKDHLFLNKYISPLNNLELDENHGSHFNICSFQLIWKNSESQKLQISEIQQSSLIENCTNFYYQIKQLINLNQTLTLNQYNIIVLSVKKIKKGCINQITQLLFSDEQLEKSMISVQFIHFNLYEESYSQVNSFQQNQNTLEIKIVNYNPSTNEELTNRYKLSKEFNRENISYCDTQSLTNLSQFKCNVHDVNRRKDQA